MKTIQDSVWKTRNQRRELEIQHPTDKLTIKRTVYTEKENLDTGVKGRIEKVTRTYRAANSTIICREYKQNYKN